MNAKLEWMQIKYEPGMTTVEVEAAVKIDDETEVVRGQIKIETVTGILNGMMSDIDYLINWAYGLRAKRLNS